MQVWFRFRLGFKVQFGEIFDKVTIYDSKNFSPPQSSISPRIQVQIQVFLIPWNRLEVIFHNLQFPLISIINPLSDLINFEEYVKNSLSSLWIWPLFTIMPLNSSKFPKIGNLVLFMTRDRVKSTTSRSHLVREYMLLMGNLTQKSWPIDAVMGAYCRGRGSGFNWRSRGSRIGGELALIPLQSEPWSPYDRAVIGPRLHVDREVGAQTIDAQINGKDCFLDSALKEPRSRLNRTTIAVRLRHDRGYLPRVFSAVRWRSDAPCVAVKRRKSGFIVAVRSRSCGLHVDEDKCSSCRHVASGKPFDRRLRSNILRTCLIWWSRWLRSTRSLPSWPNPMPAVRPRRL